MSHLATESPEFLLEKFLQNGRSEESFTLLVKATGGLVYGSAFRRTGDASLAEEVAQNVFTILARKADSLRSHSSLSSWLYRTTAFESEKSLRKELRHRRRIEKFTAEMMDNTPEPEISPDTLRLLDQSIDRLSEKDRALLLARFFEGKKFREIAAETRQSEAACKVRLRRIMNKMAGWLSGRGCTLSVTALASLLTSEWARACPSILSSGSADFLSGPSATPLTFLPQTIAAMKISKMTLAGFVLLCVAVATPFMINLEKNGPSTEPETSNMNVSSSDRVDPKGSTSRKQSLKGILTNYPYAHERLEELYQKYPILRLPEFVPADGVTLVDELNRYFEGLESDELKLPQEIRDQRRGKEAWNEESVSTFLAEKKVIIDRLLELSKLPPQQSRFRYLIGDGDPGLLDSVKAVDLLNLAFLNELRTGEIQQAEELFDAILNFQEGTSKPFLVNALVVNVAHDRLLKDLTRLAQEGYDVSVFTDKVNQVTSRETAMDSLRHEAGSFISLMEAAKQVEDPTALFQYFASMDMGGAANNKGPSVLDQILMRKEAMNWDLNDFQDDYARVLSGFFAAAPDPANPESMIHHDAGNPKLEVSHYGLPKGRELILETLMPSMILLSSRVPKTELLNRELTTWNALNAAAASGLNPSELSELVPGFLPEVPVFPATNEPFSFDPQTRTLNSPE